MKMNALTFFIVGLLFGLIAVFFGILKEYNLGGNNELGASNQFIHADAAIYACGFISAACIVTSGIVTINNKN